jgi:outer membrane protein assembly factor BamD (BamD/ComL family)
MRRLTLIVLAAPLLFLSGCSSDNGKQLYDTAQFEEKQNNKPHAIKLYEELVAKHPNSELAKKAQERLSELKKNQ